uniref:TOG domain-containing protein n=1 Tax=Anopheles farauti TaxID=69004 RepID=A0A182QAD1_9DIPT
MVTWRGPQQGLLLSVHYGQECSTSSMFFRRVFAKNGASSSSSGDSASSSSGNVNMAMHGHATMASAAGVPLESPARYRRALNVEDNHRVLSVLQLTPLWEYIIRNNELPVGLNMNELFREFLERLHDPEFQVRQHALRVLIDVIIVLRDETDIYFAPLLPPIIDNLGHPSPAVRKGALDVLKVYIAQTKLPETVMLEIMNYGMDRNPKDPLSSRYIVGVMLALPSLIQPAILTAKRTFILRAVINALGGKMVQITYQEIALKILLKIKNTIGSREFYECISVAYRRDFDLLCNVYGLPNPPKSPRRDPVVPPGEIPLGNGEMRKSWKPSVAAPPGGAVAASLGGPLQPLSPKAQRWKSGSHGDISRAATMGDPSRHLRHRRGSDDRLPQHDYVLSKGPGGGPLLRRVSLEKIDDSKVIMETEIKINKESVTMRILEAENSNSNSISEESDEDNSNKRFGVVRVLTDSELEDSVTVKSIAGSQAAMQQDLLQSSDTEYVRRTPRRVRFGGEIVKMRTPDSDTFDQSDQDAMTLSQTSNQSTQLLSSSTTSERTSLTATSAPPQRSSLKSASSSSDRSSVAYSNMAIRRQYSQSADTERTSPPSAMLTSSEFNSSITSKPRPSSAKSTMDTSYVSELNSGSDPEDNVSPAMGPSTVAEPEPEAFPTARSRPKSSLARPKSTKASTSEATETHAVTPVVEMESKPTQQQQPPETPDIQSRPEPESLPLAALDASTILADKIEEVKQAIQGIESKINNVVMKKADSADTVQDQVPKQGAGTPKLEPNLSLEVLMKTNSNENAENLEQDPSHTEHNEKDYTKELNIEIPKEEKLQNAPPPPPPPAAPTSKQPSPKAPGKGGENGAQSKAIPRIIRSGIPRLNTMPSPKSMRKAQTGTSHNAPKSPTTDGKGQLQTPQPTTGRGRTLFRTRSASSASMMRSVYISPSSLSPKPHSGIEMIHNLLRSPSTSPHRNRRKSSAASDKSFGLLTTASDSNNNHQLPPGVSAVDGRTDKCISVNEDDIFDVFGKTIATQTSVDELAEPPFVPFCRAPSRTGHADPNGNADTPADGDANGGGEHFPAGTVQPASPKQTQKQQIITTWEDLGIVDRMTLYHLKSPDWRLRSQGFGSIEEALKSSDNLAKVQPYLESLLRTLLSSERNLDVIDDKVRMLVNLVSRLPLENLEDRVGQIMTGLCRQGGPGSNTVAKALMQRLPTAAIVQRLLSDDFLHAKSSKFRENALQTVLFALMTFPSTYFDIKTLISRATEAALDRKKRVRHAALDVLAVLGQISSPKLVLDVVCAAVGTRPEGNHLITAVKARLARKQLPFIGPDGSVEYAIKVPSNRSSTVIMFGADVDWIEAGSGSASPSFNRPGRHKYPSFQVENSSYDDMRQKPSFKVFDEIQQPIETAKVSTSSGWTSKIPVTYSDNMAQPSGAVNAPPRVLYGGGQSSRSYPELMDSKLPAPFGAKPGAVANRKLDANLSGIPQIANGKLSRNVTSSSRFPEMDQKANGKTMLAKNNNPYEMRPPRTRGKLYSRNSDGFMSDTIASANKQVHSEIRPATDPVVENEGFRQSRCGMRFYNPNHMGSHNKQQMSTHVQKQEVDQRPNLSPSKSYNNHNTAANTGPNVRSNSASYGEMQNYYGESNIVSGSGTAPSTPHRTRFLGEGQPVPMINQESYIIHRDEHYDSDQDERSSNDSTSTRIISNSILSFRDRDRVTIGGDGSYSAAVPGTADRSSRPPSVSRPQSVSSSHKSIGSGVLKQQQQQQQQQQQHADGRVSRNSNGSVKNHSIGGGDNISLKSNRSHSGKITSDDRVDGEWYGGDRAATPMHSEMDGISSNQVQYESDYDEDDDEQTRQDGRNFMSKPATTPKRYPTPSPHPLQGSYSTEELSHHSSYHRAEEPEDEMEQELPISRPRSRVHSASMGNLQRLDVEEEEIDETPMPVSPKKILKKPFLVRRSGKVAPVKEVVSGVKAKNKLNEVIFQKTMRKFEKPKDALTNCLTHLESPNWEQNINGLQFFVRLIRHHPEVIDTQIHLLSVALAKQVRNLRSQVARAACQASAEFFSTHRRCLEGEAEDIATHLLHRTADTNKFLRADATQALESMCDNVSVPKVVHIIAFKGATHQNAVVRTTAAKLLNKIVQQHGSEKVFALPKETRDKLILTGAHLLLEGSLETRNYTKSDPDDRRLRKVELEVLIPKIMRERAKKEKCTAEVKAFEDCCQGSGLFMVAKCQEQNDALKACSLQWYRNEQFRQECTDIYLAERREFRRTGLPKKFRKNNESDK